MRSSVAVAESQVVDQNDKSKGSGNKRKKSERKPRSLAEAAARERSWVWEHFSKEDHPIIEKVDGNDGYVGHTRRAQCKYCTTHLACNSSSNGTSALKKHLEQVCKGYPDRTEIDKGQTHLATDGKDATVVHWTQENCITAATEMIVMDELRFSFIERPGFRRMAEEKDVKYRSYFDEDEEYDEEEGETDLNQVMPSMFRARIARRRVGPPSEADWEKATIFVRFLKVFFRCKSEGICNKSPYCFQSLS
ncbi:hypothetical protein M0R45_008201 [Rubus argutus]|uniref:BED-type domain-containing protein n=1 Tax=Rubus argutus TaxID=59490 RepID=A0AAW1Y026_RUBAR